MHITSSYIEVLIFVVIFTLMLVDVEKLKIGISFKYGRIGKHPVQSLYARYYRTL